MSNFGNYSINQPQPSYTAQQLQGTGRTQSDSKVNHKETGISKNIFNNSADSKPSISEHEYALLQSEGIDPSNLTPAEIEEVLNLITQLQTVEEKLENETTQLQQEIESEQIDIRGAEEQDSLVDEVGVKLTDSQIEHYEQLLKEVESGDLKNFYARDKNGILYQPKLKSEEAIRKFIEEAAIHVSPKTGKFIALDSNIKESSLRLPNSDGSTRKITKNFTLNKPARERIQRAFTIYLQRQPWSNTPFTSRPIPVDDTPSQNDNLVDQQETETPGHNQQPISQQVLQKQQQAKDASVAQARSLDKRDKLKHMQEFNHQLKDAMKAFTIIKETLVLDHKEQVHHEEREKYDLHQSVLKHALVSVPQMTEKLVYKDVPQKLDELIELGNFLNQNYPQLVNIPILKNLKELISRLFVKQSGPDTTTGPGDRIIAGI